MLLRVRKHPARMAALTARNRVISLDQIFDWNRNLLEQFLVDSLILDKKCIVSEIIFFLDG